jgi:signal transduction histidine kinase
MIKKIFHNMSIKYKLILIMMLTCGIVLAISAVALVVNDVREIRLSEKQKMTILAEVIAKNITAALTFNDQKAAEDTMNGLSINPHIIAAYVVSTEGTVFAEYNGPSHQGSDALLKKKIAADIVREAREETFLSFRGVDDDLEIAVPIILDNQELGLVAVRSDLHALQDQIARELEMVAGIFLFAIIGAYMIASKLQRVISEPILHMVETMETVTREKDYSIRAPAAGNDETGKLSTGFNEMLAQIQRRDDDLEHFTAELKESNEELKAFMYSAAHDLRQPLVNIKGFTAELKRSAQEIEAIVSAHADHCSNEESAQLAGILGKDIKEAEGFIGSSVERMSALINALLKISQAGHRVMKAEPICTNSLAQGILAGAAHQAAVKDAVVVIGDLPEVSADRDAMEQIMGNLLDNALKYLVPERPGRVEISGERDDNSAVFHIRDNGRGIREDEIPRLFQLFRRLGRQDIPGEGVGLAYVKALVKRHGGRIWCESEPGKGSVFSFAIPQPRIHENDKKGEKDYE